MTKNEEQLVLEGFNTTDKEYDSHAFVHGLFMKHARERPGAPCVVYEDNVFTYAQVKAVGVTRHSKLATAVSLCWHVMWQVQTAGHIACLTIYKVKAGTLPVSRGCRYQQNGHFHLPHCFHAMLGHGQLARGLCWLAVDCWLVP